MTHPFSPRPELIAQDLASESTDAFSLPASFAQQRLWLQEQLEPGKATYNVPVGRRLRGPLSVAALERAISLVVERHEPLRTVFDGRQGELLQVILPHSPLALPILDLSRLPDEEREAEMCRLARSEANRAFDLAHGPVFRAALVRMADNDHVLFLTAHHIAVDGWSVGVLLREIATAYNAFVAHQEPVLSPLDVQYADFAAWQRDELDSGELTRQTEYWREQLRGPLPYLDLPWDHARRPDSVHPAGSLPLHVPKATSDAIAQLARDERVTPFVVLTAAFATLLHRCSGASDIVLASPVSGRSRRETESLIGFFVNTLALRFDLTGDPTFRELLGRARNVIFGAMSNQDVPFDKLVELAGPRRDRSRHPISPVIVGMHEGGGSEIRMTDLDASPVRAALESAKFDLQLQLRNARDGFRGTLDYDADLFEEETVRRLLSQYVVLLGSIADDASQRIATLDLLDDLERTRIAGWSSPRSSYRRDATVPALFREWAARTPNAVAVEQGSRRMSYGALDAASDAVASALRSAGVTPESLVAVALERSPEAIVAILGVLKAGAGYVPLDPDYPPDRLAFMLDDTAVATVLTARPAPRSVLAALGEMTGGPPRLLDVETCIAVKVGMRADPADAPGATTSPPSADGVAYVMFTSGSTGRPKGVVVPHRAIVRLVSNTNYAQFGPEHVMLGFAPLSFDASTFEIWGALLNGGRLALAPRGRVGPAELGETVTRHGVTTMWLTAALFNQVVNAGLDAFSGVRQLLAGGDVLSVPHVLAALRALPAVRLVNGYGPTENTTFTTCYEIPRDLGSARTVPIGRPISNTRAYVLDAARQPVPVGVVGELYAGGDGVALGYLHRPELTAERFVPDPFSAVPGAHMYRTGDLVRWRADGTIAFLGRSDDQVKIRGFRIEPGEVEAALRSHPSVRECAVLVDREAVGGARLVAYYATTNAGRESGTLPQRHAELRSHLRALLPEYMVPAAFVAVSALPIGPTGKLDRRALPPVPTDGNDARETYVAPRTTLEHELVHIWEQLLGRRPIGIEDDFFDIGGHSLLAVQMLAAVERVRGRRVPLSILFECATIDRLAAKLESDPASESANIVHLQEGGARRPLVFLHGDVRGGGWYCRRLAPLLGLDRPMIVLPTLAGASPDAPITIEDIAAAHITELRAHQAHGPYRIAGFCAGGLIAYEMARQLSAAGETIERLIVIDATPRGARFRLLAPFLPLLFRSGTPEERLTRRGECLRKLHYYRGRLLQFRRMTPAERTRWVRINIARRIPYFGVEDEAAIWPTAPAEFRARPATKMLEAQARAAAAYIPRGYRGDIDVIWSGRETSSNPSRGWDEVGREVRVHTVPSEHVALITYDLPQLAAALRACLDPETA